MGNSEASLRDPADNLRPRDEAGVDVIVSPENIPRSRILVMIDFKLISGRELRMFNLDKTGFEIRVAGRCFFLGSILLKGFFDASASKHQFLMIFILLFTDFGQKLKAGGLIELRENY